MMKTSFKKIVTLALLLVSVKAMAQTALDPALPIGFTADVGSLFERGEVSNYTDKYNGYQSAELFFNARVVKLTVYKKVPVNCIMAPCPESDLMAREVVYFQVKAVERIGCYDAYYAKTADILESGISEKVIIQRFAFERCQAIAEMPQGSIHYKISAKNSSGEIGSAQVWAPLKNMKLVKVDLSN